MNEESIDSRIAEYEYMLNVRSKPLSLKEEKNILMEIKKLKASRPAAIKHTKELEALKAGAAATDGVSVLPCCYLAYQGMLEALWKLGLPPLTE